MSELEQMRELIRRLQLSYPWLGPIIRETLAALQQHKGADRG